MTDPNKSKKDKALFRTLPDDSSFRGAAAEAVDAAALHSPSTADRIFSGMDANIMRSTMMYEAEELGVHTIWIRGFDSKTVADTFGLTEHMIPVMMLGLGYPNERAKANAWHCLRKPIEEFVIEL